MWCACADAVRDTGGKCGSKPHWGSARFTPCDTPRSYHHCVAPTVPRRRLSRSRPPRSLSKLGVRLFSRERLYIPVCCRVASTRIINEPSTVVFGARRAVLRAGRARSAPPPARRARGQHPADGHGHAVYNIRKTDTPLSTHPTGTPGHRPQLPAARDTRTCKHRPVDLRFTTLIRLQQVLLRRVEENSLFLRVTSTAMEVGREGRTAALVPRTVHCHRGYGTGPLRRVRTGELLRAHQSGTKCARLRAPRKRQKMVGIVSQVHTGQKATVNATRLLTAHMVATGMARGL